MAVSIREYFGLCNEPFAQDISVAQLYPLPALTAVNRRFEYCLQIAGISIVTGEIGSGKSTCLRACVASTHPAEYRLAQVIGLNNSPADFLRQCLFALGELVQSNSVTRLVRQLHQVLADISGRRQKPVLIIDEAHVLRTEIFAQLHTLAQAPYDEKPLLSIVLCGQNQLLDKLQSLSSRAFASRVIARTHVCELKINDMQGYLQHHLQIAGSSPHLINEQAQIAIHQCSGGLLRRANNLARGAMLAAAQQQQQQVSAEHVRIAATELF